MLKHRLISGLSLVGFICAFVFWPHRLASVLFLIFGLGLVILAMREFFQIAKGVGAPGYRRTTLVAGVALALVPALVTAFPAVRGLLGDPDQPQAVAAFLDFAIIGIFLLSCFSILFRSPDFEVGVRGFFASAAGFFYVGWTMAFLSRIFFFGYDWDPQTGASGSYLFLYVVLVTKFGDIGGYAVGNIASKRAGGNHKIIPRVSPGKSWEGLCGSVLFSVGIALFLSYAFGTHLNPGNAGALSGWQNVFVAVFMALLGLVSDLTESVLKRAGKVKDSGSSIPGLGGVLDAVDSLLLVAPVFYCYLLFATSR